MCQQESFTSRMPNANYRPQADITGCPLMEIKYEKRLVAFVDILGWAKAMESNSAAFLYDVLEPLRNYGEIHNEGVRQEIINKFGKNANPLFLNVQYSFFSDCFIYSMPVSMGSRIYDSISKIVQLLLNKGFVARGGITSGNMFHRDQIAFGPALVAAYRIEADEAKFARVMIADSAIKETGIGEHDAVMRDHLGNLIVDPFPLMATTDDMRNLLEQLFNPTGIIQILSQNISDFSGQSRQKDIWRFQAEVCALSLEKYGEVANDWVIELRNIARNAAAQRRMR